MTMTGIYSVGYCSHDSPQGGWAFKLALNLARRRELHLKVFHFLSDPYDPDDTVAESLSRDQRDRLAIARERELRLNYDERLGDFLEVGFRVCEDREWTELHRCLSRREFQLLILGYPSYGATFGGRPLEAFVQDFVCPIVLVGPTSPTEYYLNSPAELIAEQIGLGARRFHVLRNRESA